MVFHGYASEQCHGTNKGTQPDKTCSKSTKNTSDQHIKFASS